LTGTSGRGSDDRQELLTGASGREFDD